jgi:hypothetical protein
MIGFGSIESAYMVETPEAFCKRCHKSVKELEEHHLFPKFMNNPHGYSFENYPNRVLLCLNCHKALHQVIIIPLLNRLAKTPKYNGSVYYIWNNFVIDIDKPFIIKSIIEASYKFIFDKEFEYGNT